MLRKVFIIFILGYSVFEMIAVVNFFNYRGDELLEHQLKSCKEYYSLLGIKFPVIKMYHLCAGVENNLKEAEDMAKRIMRKRKAQ